MSQTLTLRYTPIEKDYAKVLRLFFLQRTGTRVSLALLVIAFGFIIFAITANGMPPTIYELIWLLLPPLFVVFVFYFQPARVARQASENEQLISETTWEVNDDGVQISSRFGSTHLGWDAMKKLVTTRE
jgi:fatty acid desaturase